MDVIDQETFDRLKARATVDEDSGCWLLRPRPGAQGYSYISVRGKVRRAHRAMYEAIHGANSADGKIIRHRCNTRNCICPKHLRAGTRAANYEDAVRHGRVGEGFKPSLSHSDVAEIYESDRTSYQLAKLFNVSPETIRRIWRGQTWRRVTKHLQAGANCAKLRQSRGLE